MDVKKAIKILELSSCEDPKEIRDAFYLLAHKYHPDKNQSDTTDVRFREIVKAYEFCLKNQKEVLQHFGSRQQKFVEADENLEDVFFNIFGFDPSGEGIGYLPPQNLELSLEELLLGAEKNEKIAVYSQCQTCHGLGTAYSDRLKICRYCFGQGALATSGNPSQKTVCPKCEGIGRDIKHKCRKCKGLGHVATHYKLKLTLPKGLQVGEVYELDGFEENLQQTFPFSIRVITKPHPVFKIAKSDLICQYPIDFSNSEVWQKRYVLQTLDGEAVFQLAKGSVPGDVVVLSGKGLYLSPKTQTRGDIRIELIKKKGFWKTFLGGLLGS